MSEQNNNATMATPALNTFKLGKVKLDANGGIRAHYDVTELKDGQTYQNHYVVNKGMAVHSDLTTRLQSLTPIVAKVFHIQDETFIWDHMRVLGLSISGKGDNVGVVITSALTAANGLATCINTPRIKLYAIPFGFETELATIVSTIEREVYAYLFEGKQAQLSVFGGESQE